MRTKPFKQILIKKLVVFKRIFDDLSNELLFHTYLNIWLSPRPGGGYTLYVEKISNFPQSHESVISHLVSYLHWCLFQKLLIVPYFSIYDMGHTNNDKYEIVHTMSSKTIWYALQIYPQTITRTTYKVSNSLLFK